jgi:hypothetical protein
LQKNLKKEMDIIDTEALEATLPADRLENIVQDLIDEVLRLL